MPSWLLFFQPVCERVSGKSQTWLALVLQETVCPGRVGIVYRAHPPWNLHASIFRDSFHHFCLGQLHGLAEFRVPGPIQESEIIGSCHAVHTQRPRGFSAVTHSMVFDLSLSNTRTKKSFSSSLNPRFSSLNLSNQAYQETGMLAIHPSLHPPQLENTAMPQDLTRQPYRRESSCPFCLCTKTENISSPPLDAQ